MSTAQILSTISTVCYVLAAVSLAMAVFFWFSFKIPRVIGDLSGRTARKSIEKIRKGNESLGSNTAQPSRGSTKRDVLYSSHAATDGKTEAGEAASTELPETGLLEGPDAPPVQDASTELMDSDATTALLDEDATELLAPAAAPVQKRTGGRKLTILEEVMMIHTDEVIG